MGGYYIKLQNNGNIHFCKDKIKDKLLNVAIESNYFYQYTYNRMLRWKTFKTYVAPYIELFLPLQIQTGLCKKSIVRRIQHSCRAKAMNISYKCGRVKLRNIMNEMSMEEKCSTLAHRLTYRLTDTQKLLSDT